jgi:hypothetical protein
MFPGGDEQLQLSLGMSKVTQQAADSHEMVDWSLQFRNKTTGEAQPSPRGITTTDTNELVKAIKQGWLLTARQAGELILWLDPRFIDHPVSARRAYKVATDEYNRIAKESKATADLGRRRNKRKASVAQSKSKSIASRAFLRPTASLEAHLATSREKQRIQQDIVKKQKLQIKGATADAVQMRQRLSKVSHERKELKADSAKKNKEIRRLQTAARAEPSARDQRVKHKGPASESVYTV